MSNINNVVVCNKCKFYRRGDEYSVSMKFIEIPPDDGDIYIPFDLVSEGDAIKMCQHEDCFDLVVKRSIVEIEDTELIRVNGQAQFNHNNDCYRFQPKPWYRKIFG